MVTNQAQKSRNKVFNSIELSTLIENIDKDSLEPVPQAKNFNAAELKPEELELARVRHAIDAIENQIQLIDSLCHYIESALGNFYMLRDEIINHEVVCAIQANAEHMSECIVELTRLRLKLNAHRHLLRNDCKAISSTMPSEQR